VSSLGNGLDGESSQFLCERRNQVSKEIFQAANGEGEDGVSAFATRRQSHLREPRIVPYLNTSTRSSCSGLDSRTHTDLAFRSPATTEEA
jgi:hypothetical protein